MPVRDLLSAASGTASYGPSDPYFYDVSLLLNGDGTNGAQNNTFLDSSTNNFTITRNGNTTQGSFSPYGSNWSMYDSGGNYLSTSYTGSVATNGDFTVEGWFNLSAYPNNSNMAVGSANLSIIAVLSGNFATYMPSSGWVQHGAFPLNQWNYCVVQRSGGTVSSYLNGTRLDTYSASEGWTYNTLEALVGQSANRQVGYYSNVRISSVARYSGTTMTVPTAPVSTDGNTTFLLCSSNRFIDASGNNRNVTVNSTPSVQRFSPFNPTAPYSTSVIGGSGYFNSSTSDYLRTTSNAALTLGTGNWTVECWVYPTSNAAYKGIFGTGASTNGCVELFTNGANGLTYNFYGPGSSNDYGSNLYANQWNHVALTRSSGNLYISINGSTSSGFSSGGSDTAPGTLFDIGQSASSRGWYFPGYITNFRATIGTALYTTSYTVPTAPLAPVTNTQLLTNMVNAGIPDLAMQNNLQTVGDAQVSTSVKKYGTGSLAFDGTGDYLLSNAPSTDLYAFGTGNFTIEFWIYFNSVSGTIILYDPRNTSETNCPVLYMSSGVLYFYASGSNLITGSSLSTSTWYHIALARSGTSTKLFINGTQSGSTYTDTNNYVCQTNRPAIAANGYGAGGGVGSYPLNGYIDDFRITKGLARYTTTFTPPTSALPTY